MPDILSHGGDREPRRWPRRVTVVAVLLLAAVVIVQIFPRHRHATTQPRPAVVTGPPAPLVAAAPAGPDGILGHTLPWPGSLRLPEASEQPLWLWPATGRTTRIGGLPRDKSGYVFIRAGGGWAIQPGPSAGPGCGTCAGVPVPVYFLADRAQSVTRAGTANQVAPAATAGALWLTSYPPGADLSTAAGAAHEVSAAGAPLGPVVRLPAGYVILRATGRGLLLGPAVQRLGATADKLWDPASARAGRTFPGVIAASATEIASVMRCAPVCRVQVLDLATGRRTLIGLHGASSAANAAFSPDGRFLAVEVSFSHGADDGATATQIDVASLGSGSLRVVPGTWASSDALAGFGWPAGSATLVAELSFTTKLQVAAWHPGAARLAVAVVRPRLSSATLIVG